MNKQVPKNLDTEARKFWDDHKKACADNGSLTDETYNSFALLCRVWSMLQACDPTIDSKEAMRFSGLVKYYMALAKPFGLLASKPPVKKSKGIGEILQEVLANAEQSEAHQDEQETSATSAEAEEGV